MPPSRTLSAVVTVGVTGLVASGILHLGHQMMKDAWRERLIVPTTVTVALTDAPFEPFGGGAGEGGGSRGDLKPDETPVPSLLQPVSRVRELPTQDLPRLEEPVGIPETTRDLPTLATRLLAEGRTPQGIGLGNGRGGEVGNGVAGGQGRRRGSLMVHSAQGVEEVVSAPSRMVYKDYVYPDYPSKAIDNRISGDVIVEVTITPDARLERFNILEGHPLLVEATRKVVPLWKFLPVVHKGRPVRATFDVVVRFTLM